MHCVINQFPKICQRPRKRLRHKKLTFSGSNKDNFDNKLWCRPRSTSPCLDFGVYILNIKSYSLPHTSALRRSWEISKCLNIEKKSNYENFCWQHCRKSLIPQSSYLSLPCGLSFNYMDGINCNGEWAEDPVLKITNVLFFRFSFSNCRFKKLNLANYEALIFTSVEFLLTSKLTP